MKYKVIIPARGGSKRFPGKNIALFRGVPLLYHTIDYTLSHDIFDPSDVWINTDCDTIAQFAEKKNINIYRRPEYLGSDIASTGEVLYDHAKYFEEKGVKYDAMILLQVTNPLRPKGMIQEAIGYFEDKKRASLASFSPLNKKIGKFREERFIPENYLFGQRMQDMEPQYYENGLIYITTKDKILQKIVMSEDVYPYLIDHPYAAVDIDEEMDLDFAELISKKYKE